METSDAIAGFEFPYFVTDAVNDACDVIARVEFFVEPFGDFPGGV